MLTLFTVLGMTLSLLGIILIIRPFTVIFHELGHALAALLLTRKKVKVYIGSLGDPAKSIRFGIGPLKVWFRYNPFLWNCGLMAPSVESVSINKEIIYTLCGPLASFILAAIACYISYSYDLGGIPMLLIVLFLGSAIWDMVVNLIPRPEPVKLYDGTIVYNDGQSLRNLFAQKKLQKRYDVINELYNSGKYDETAALLEKLASDGDETDQVYRVLAACYLREKDYVHALAAFERFEKKQLPMNADDFCNYGLMQCFAGKFKEARDSYDRSLALNPDHVYSLNNKAYLLVVEGEYAEALPLAEKCITMQPDFDHAYNNRGLARLKLGSVEDGLKDIRHSLSLDPKNAYAYLNLGIYHLGRNEKQEAMTHFLKAKELDADTYRLKEFMELAS